VCGQTEYLVLHGLCHECQQAEDRAANGGKPLVRTAEDIFDTTKVRTVLVGRPD
jgi:hypothetical protein